MPKTSWSIAVLTVVVLGVGAIGAACGGDDSAPELSPEEQEFCDEFNAVQDDLEDQEAAEPYTEEAVQQIEDSRAALGEIEAPAAIRDDWEGQLAALDETIAIYQEMIDSGIGPDTPEDDPDRERFSAQLGEVDTTASDNVADYLDRC